MYKRLWQSTRNSLHKPFQLPASEQLIKMSDSEDEAENESKKHPRLRDLNNSHRMSLTTVASSYFSCTVLTGNPFPEGITVSDMVLRAWKVASDELGVEFLPPSVDERALVRIVSFIKLDLLLTISRSFVTSRKREEKSRHLHGKNSFSTTPSKD